MASKPMLVFFTALLQTCHLKGKTSIHESGIMVSTRKLAGETLLIFHTDCDEGRKSLRMTTSGIKICDYLVFYTKDGDIAEVVCFLELKGSGLKDASKQVLETHQHTIAVLKEISRKEQYQHVSWKVCICLHGQASRGSRHIQDELIQTFGKSNICIKHGITKFDIGEILRKNTK